MRSDISELEDVVHQVMMALQDGLEAPRNRINNFSSWFKVVIFNTWKRRLKKIIDHRDLFKETTIHHRKSV